MATPRSSEHGPVKGPLLVAAVLILSVEVLAVAFGEFTWELLVSGVLGYAIVFTLVVAITKIRRTPGEEAAVVRRFHWPSPFQRVRALALWIFLQTLLVAGVVALVVGG